MNVEQIQVGDFDAEIVVLQLRAQPRETLALDRNSPIGQDAVERRLGGYLSNHAFGGGTHCFLWGGTAVDISLEIGDAIMNVGGQLDGDFIARHDERFVGYRFVVRVDML